MLQKWGGRVTWLFTVVDGTCFKLSQVKQGNFSLDRHDQVEKKTVTEILCQFHFPLLEVLWKWGVVIKSVEVHCSQRIYFISFMYSSALEVTSYNLTHKKNFFFSRF